MRNIQISNWAQKSIRKQIASIVTYIIIQLSFLLQAPICFSQAIEWKITLPGKTVAITGDHLGFLFHAAHFEDTVKILQHNYISQGEKDILITKYTEEGSPIWSTLIGGNLDDSLSGMVVDTSGIIWITGHFRGNFSVGNYSFTSLGLADAFVIKMDGASGKILKAVRIGGPAFDEGISIMRMKDNHIWISGNYAQSIQIGNTTLPGNNLRDIFISCWNEDLQLIWAKSINGPGVEMIYAADQDSLNNYYLTGYSSSATSIILGQPYNWNGENKFILKLDSTGNLAWKSQMKFEGHFSSIAVYKAGTVYLTGVIRSQLMVGGINYLHNYTDDEILMVVLNANGTFYGASKWGGYNETDYGAKIKIRGSGDGSMCGMVEGVNIAMNGTNINTQGLNRLLFARFNLVNLISNPYISLGTARTSGIDFFEPNPETIFFCAQFESSGTLQMGNSTFTGQAGECALLKIHYNTNILKGLIYYDQNTSLLLDSLDIPATQITMKHLSTFTKTNLKGEYLFKTGIGNYTIFSDLSYNTYGSPFEGFCQSNSIQNTINGLGNVRKLPTLGLCRPAKKPNLTILLHGKPLLVPDEKVQYFIDYRNSGTEHENATIKLKLDSALQMYTADPIPTTQIGNTLIWDIGNLREMSGGKIKIICQPIFMLSPGDSLKSIASIESQPGATSFILNSDSALSRIDSTSWSVIKTFRNIWNKDLPLNSSPFGRFTIYFRNNVKDTSHFLIIRDLIQTPIIPESCTIAATSHPFRFYWDSPASLELIIDSAKLPNCAVDSINSWGYVSVDFNFLYSNGWWLEDSLQNQALVYFDYKPALSNKAIYLVKYSPWKTNPDQNNEYPLLIFPIPSSESISVKCISPDIQVNSIQIYDNSGKKVNSVGYFANINPQETILDHKNLPDGIYILNIETNKGHYFRKIVVQN